MDFEAEHATQATTTAATVLIVFVCIFFSAYEKVPRFSRLVRYQKTDRAREFTYKKSARDLKFLCGTEMINLFCFNFQDP